MYLSNRPLRFHLHNCDRWVHKNRAHFPAAQPGKHQSRLPSSSLLTIFRKRLDEHLYQEWFKYSCAYIIMGTVRQISRFLPTLYSMKRMGEESTVELHSLKSHLKYFNINTHLYTYICVYVHTYTYSELKFSYLYGNGNTEKLPSEPEGGSAPVARRI